MSTPEGGSGASSWWATLGVSDAIDQAVEVAHKVGAGSGQFEMSLEEMRAVRAEWQAVFNELEDMRKSGTRLAQVEGAGAEVASEGQARMANESGARYMTDLDAMRDYAGSYVESLDQVIARYGQTDGGSADTFRRLRGELA
ncbi:MAG: hypothetical protein M3443_06970 [Actinomycetota bacterium]|nr:hypothetical protein [Actinomycetota bacterium]